MRALRLTKARVIYKDSESPALDDVSVEVEEGEIVLLLGANNAGKTTFCRLLNGLVPHSIPAEVQGEIEVLGRNALKSSVARLATMVGMVFQEPESQLFCMSVEEEIAFGPENIAVPREKIAERVEWALEAVGLSGYNPRSPSTLSGGEKQRLAIAAALSMNPRMLVLDEPTYALDPAGRTELYALLLELREKYNMTIVMAERDAEEVSGLCDRVLLLSKGRIAADGRPKSVLSRVQDLKGAGVEPPQIATLNSLVLERYRGRITPFFTLEDAERELTSLLEAKGEGQ